MGHIAYHILPAFGISGGTLDGAIQDHVHLAPVLSSNAEQSPAWKFFIEVQQPEHVLFTNLSYSLQGDSHFFVRKGNDGKPILYNHMLFSVRVRAEEGYTLQERLQQLRSMQGRFVYFVPHFHPDDNNDHTHFIQRMFMEPIVETNIDPALTVYNVEVILRDAERNVEGF